MLEMKGLVGSVDLVLITLDTLRYDAAQSAWQSGRLPVLSPYLGSDGWEQRHTPASFTYAAHQAFLSGFLPTPVRPGPHPRLFAAAFPGSATTVKQTYVFEHATLPEALAAVGYRTICIGGTGFFNGQSELGRVLPRLFQEHHWNTDLGVTCAASPINQVALAVQRLRASRDRRVFLLLNVAAIHQPNWFYGGIEGQDNLETHTAALCAVDSALAPLFAELGHRGHAVCILCSDHGTAYGESGYHGHRLGHDVVWQVPYAEFVL